MLYASVIMVYMHRVNTKRKQAAIIRIVTYTITLILTVGWEVYQAGDGGREEFNPFVNPIENTVLFPASLETHIQNGRVNLIQDSSDFIIEEELE